MAGNDEKDFRASEPYAIINRRNRHFRNSKTHDSILPDCAGSFANLEIRLQTLEKSCEKLDRKLNLLHNSIAKLQQIKQFVMAWAVAAGTIASFVYSNLETVKHMFH